MFELNNNLFSLLCLHFISSWIEFWFVGLRWQGWNFKNSVRGGHRDSRHTCPHYNVGYEHSRVVEVPSHRALQQSTNNCPQMFTLISTEYEARWKVLGLTFVKLRTSGRWVGTRTGAGVTSTLEQRFLCRSSWIHGLSGSTFLCCRGCPWSHGLRTRKLYNIVDLTPAPVRVPTQRPLVPSCTSVVA